MIWMNAADVNECNSFAEINARWMVPQMNNEHNDVGKFSLFGIMNGADVL
jgi:hypothetical protein